MNKDEINKNCFYIINQLISTNENHKKLYSKIVQLLGKTISICVWNKQYKINKKVDINQSILKPGTSHDKRFK